MNDAVHTPQEDRYSYTNPPTTIDDAKKRLDELGVDIARIEADLRTRTERDLGTPDAYDDWKFRATRALNHKEREKRFLLQWIDHTVRQASQAQREISKQESAKELNALVDAFLASATPYQATFSQEKPPTELRKAEERRVELVDLKFEYEEFLVHLKEEASRLGCSPNFQGGGRGRAAKVIQKAERELLLIKQFKRTAASSETGHLPDPLPSGDSRLSAIHKEIAEIKARLGMGNAEMTVWLFELITRKKLRLKREDSEKLKLIGQYAQLTLQRKAIEFRE